MSKRLDDDWERISALIDETLAAGAHPETRDASADETIDNDGNFRLPTRVTYLPRIDISRSPWSQAVWIDEEAWIDRARSTHAQGPAFDLAFDSPAALLAAAHRIDNQGNDERRRLRAIFELFIRPRSQEQRIVVEPY